MQLSLKPKLKFPGLAELAAFALSLRLGFVIDIGKLTLQAALSKKELERGLNIFHGSIPAA